MDSSKFNFPSDVAKSLSLAKAVKYDFGGTVETDAVYDILPLDSFSQKHNFSGCIASKFKRVMLCSEAVAELVSANLHVTVR